MKENSNDDTSIKSTKINNNKKTGQINESYESSKQDVVHIFESTFTWKQPQTFIKPRPINEINIKKFNAEINKPSSSTHASWALF